MPSVKTAVKKTVKTAKKPALKAAKKITMDDVWAAIEATNKQLKETSRIVGDLGNRFGGIAEHFLTPGLHRMEKLRRYADLRGDTRQFHCTMAAMAVKKTVLEYTLAKGFYLIMPSGEDVKVTKPVSEKVW